MPQWTKYALAIVAAHFVFLMLAKAGLFKTDSLGHIRWTG